MTSEAQRKIDNNSSRKFDIFLFFFFFYFFFSFVVEHEPKWWKSAAWNRFLFIGPDRNPLENRKYKHKGSSTRCILTVMTTAKQLTISGFCCPSVNKRNTIADPYREYVLEKQHIQWLDWKLVPKKWLDVVKKYLTSVENVRFWPFLKINMKSIVNIIDMKKIHKVRTQSEILCLFVSTSNTSRKYF